MEILIVTGLSGAGKSQAANALEDIGYFCIDNMPPSLIPQFAEMYRELKKNSKVAVVTDVRTGDMFGGFFDALKELEAIKVRYKILFLDAGDDALVKRFSESRRKHPLTSENVGIIDAIRDERAMLKPLLELADYRIDTTYISSQQLKDRIISMFLTDSNMSMRVRCISFGYKHGIPNDCDLVLDVRFLPNPFYVDELKAKTGLDSDVINYVMSNEITVEMLDRFYNMIDFLLPFYRAEGKSQLIIGIGCTGGKHRSVAIAEHVSGHILERGYNCKAIHRDISKLL